MNVSSVTEHLTTIHSTNQILLETEAVLLWGKKNNRAPTSSPSFILQKKKKLQLMADVKRKQHQKKTGEENRQASSTKRQSKNKMPDTVMYNVQPGAMKLVL